MPFDVLECTRATMKDSHRSTPWSKGLGNLIKLFLALGQDLGIIVLEPGISRNCGSSSRVESVPALRTHRPSLLPIGWVGESLGLLLIPSFSLLKKGNN